MGISGRPRTTQCEGLQPPEPGERGLTIHGSANRTADACPPHRASREDRARCAPCLFPPLEEQSCHARTSPPAWAAGARITAGSPWVSGSPSSSPPSSAARSPARSTSRRASSATARRVTPRSVIDKAGFKDRAGEMMLITYPGHTVNDPAFRAAIDQAVDRVERLPAGHQRPQPPGHEQRRPDDEGRPLGARAVRHHGRPPRRPRTSIQPVMNAVAGAPEGASRDAHRGVRRRRRPPTSSTTRSTAT